MANQMESFNFTPGPSLVAMATKFGTKWAITRHNVYEISARFLHLTRGFEGGANK